MDFKQIPKWEDCVRPVSLDELPADVALLYPNVKLVAVRVPGWSEELEERRQVGIRQYWEDLRLAEQTAKNTKFNENLRDPATEGDTSLGVTTQNRDKHSEAARPRNDKKSIRWSGSP